MANLSSSVFHWALSEPDRLALVYGDSRITYGELAVRTRRVAALLQERGIGENDIVALLMKNSAAFIELALAISHLGAVLLPVNYRLGAEEVEYILQHSGARLVCVDEEFRENVGSFNALVVTERDQHGLAQDTGTPHVDLPARRRKPSDIFRLMYTSGTTDRPKGVIHTYENFHWKTLDHICELGLTREDRLLMVGPLYHVGAFDLPGIALILVGGTLVVLRDFDAHAVLTTMQDEKITGAWLAPVMLNRLLLLNDSTNYDLTSVKWIVGGGERTPVERIRSFNRLFTKGRYVDAYGLTETCSGDTMMQAGRELEKIGSAGRALSHVDIEIRDPDGNPLPPGETGEICLRGPKVTKGYWKDPKRTEASFFGEWFRSGDMGYLDEDGFLFLVDRKKDMIISGGENIASSEVERVIYQLDIVEEAAVIGLPDEQWGERVTAVVVLREGASLTLEELKAHCRGKLGSFKMPRELIVTDALPRNPSGKILKRSLRDIYNPKT